MSTLRELQAAFRSALLEGEHGADHAVPGVLGDGLTAGARLRIYRHHVFATLTAALAVTFPVVRRLVGEGFFRYAADAYIRVHPPAGPCLSEYGASLPDFLGEFPPCRHLEYLPDVARLEWSMNEALHAPEPAPVAAEALRAVAPEALAGARLALDPSLALLASPWPIDRIWQANQADADPEAIVGLAAGGVRLAVRRVGDTVVLERLDAGRWALWQALRIGQALEEAAGAALATDPGFDVSEAVADLLAGRLLVGVDIIAAGPSDAPSEWGIRDGTDDDRG